MKVSFVVVLLSLVSVISGDQICTDCEKLVVSLMNFMTNIETQQKVQQEVDTEICDRLTPEQKPTCEMYAMLFIPPVFQYLDAYVTPALVCNSTHLCPGVQSKMTKVSGLEAGQFCEYCQVVTSEIKEVIANPTVRSDIKAALFKLCSLLPLPEETCQTTVQEYADKIFVALENFFKDACEDLGVCPPQQQLLVA